MEVPPAAAMTVEWMTGGTLPTLAEHILQCSFCTGRRDAHQLEVLLDAARTVFEQVEASDPETQQSQITLCSFASTLLR